MQTHNKWLLGLIITSMVVSLLLFCVGMADFFGAYSIFMSPAATVLTEIFHSVSLPVWKHTAKKRRGQPKTTSIYSIASIVLTCLLAVVWLAVALTYTVITAIVGAEGDTSIAMASIETLLAWIGMLVLWAEFGIQVHFRKRVLKQIKQGQFGGQQQQQNQQQNQQQVGGVYHQQGMYQQQGAQQKEQAAYQQYPPVNQYHNYAPPPPVNVQGQGHYDAGGVKVNSFVQKSSGW